MSELALCARDGSDPVFVSPAGVITAGQFVGAALRLADSLPPGSHAVNLCRDRLQFALAFAAAFLRGQVSLLCADTSPGHLRRLAERFEGAYAIADAPGCASPLRLATVPAWDASCEPAASPSLPAEQLAALVFTSGSTGEPVAHAKRWGQLATRSAAAAEILGLGGATVVGTVPPQHMYGFETTVLLPLHAPVTAWCGDAFFPADIAAALAAAPAPRVLVTTPLHLRTLLDAGTGLPQLHRIVSATAPLQPALAAAAEARWDTEVHEIFGATEVGSIATRRTVAGNVWRAYPGVHVGETVAAPWAEECELGDRIEAAPGGFRLLGRQSDLVKVGGRRASLAGLTAALLRLPGVTDAAMLPPHNDEGRMTAFVVAPGRRAEDLLAALRHEIDPAFLPRPLLCVERLPRNEVGKLPRAALDALRAAVPA